MLTKAAGASARHSMNPTAGFPHPTMTTSRMTSCTSSARPAA